MIIAIDGGTTNTRLTLMDGGKIIKKYKLNVGARDKSLAEAVRGGLAEVMCPAVTRIAASGMITSDAGLFSLPHIAAPPASTSFGPARSRSPCRRSASCRSPLFPA